MNDLRAVRLACMKSIGSVYVTLTGSPPIRTPDPKADAIKYSTPLRYMVQGKTPSASPMIATVDQNQGREHHGAHRRPIERKNVARRGPSPRLGPSARHVNPSHSDCSDFDGGTSHSLDPGTGFVFNERGLTNNDGKKEVIR